MEVLPQRALERMWCDTLRDSALSLTIQIWVLIIHKQFLFSRFCCQLSIVSLLSWLLNLSSSSPLVRVHWLCSNRVSPAAEDEERSSINTALLIDAPLQEHKEPVTDCHKRLRRSEKRGLLGPAPEVCELLMWNIWSLCRACDCQISLCHLSPPLMISPLRHARLQRGPQLHHNSATLRRVC